MLQVGLCLLPLFINGTGWGQAPAVRGGKREFGIRERRRAPLRRVSAKKRKIWRLHAVLGVAHDEKINHLLTNLNIKSDRRRPDNIIHSGAGFALKPRWGKRLKADLSYAFNRYEYSRNGAFTYFAHSASAGLEPKMTRRWSLDLGGDFDWVVDDSGPISNSQAGHGGLVWSGPAGLSLKGGYEYRRDSVTVNPLKDARSDIAYLGYLQPILSHYVFAQYRFRANRARAGNFSYKSHSARLGLIARWTKRFTTTFSGSYLDKPYDNLDTRFQTVRHDRLYGLTLKPAVTLLPGLEAVGSLTYLKNDSNVPVKRYTDRIYSLGLEARF